MFLRIGALCSPLGCLLHIEVKEALPAGLLAICIQTCQGELSSTSIGERNYWRQDIFVLTSMVEDRVVIISPYSQGLATEPVPQGLVVLEACRTPDSAQSSEVPAESAAKLSGRDVTC